MMSMKAMKRAALGAALAAVIVSWAAAAGAHELPEGFSGFRNSLECATCHEEIYDEWSESMHASSSYFNDSLHESVADAFADAMEAKGARPNYHCASCHTPTADNMAALMKGDAMPDGQNPTNVAGVTCDFCHKVDSVIEGDKFHTYRMADATTGPDPDSDKQHGWKKWSFSEPYEMCLGCHGKKISGKGGVVCSMEEEGIADCTDCHMPRVPGLPAAGSVKQTHAFHGMFGGHDQAMLQEGASVSLKADGGRLTVTLANPNPHYFPSTNPLRVAYLRVEAYDEAGVPVFANFVKDPAEDPDAVLVKMFKAGDRTGVPSWEAEGVASDTRLKPGESRQLTYEMPKSAVRASARLYYRFAPQKLIDKLDVEPDGIVDVQHLVSGAETTL